MSSSGIESRDSELQKLDDLRRRVPAVSASALARLLQDIEKSGLPSLKHRKQLCASAGQPLNLVFYSDEVTPGNVLSADTSRKLWAVYLSFLYGIWITSPVERRGLDTSALPAIEACE